MGCWGMGIMQSDDALDAQADILDLIGVDVHSPNKRSVQDGFTLKFNEIENLCNNQSKRDVAVYWQVFATIGMEHGRMFTKEQQQKIIKGLEICEEYQLGKDVDDFNELKLKVEDYYIKNFGLEAYKENQEIWGENSYTERIRDRTKNIDQLIKKFKSFCINDFKEIKNQDAGLMSVFTKKSLKK